MDSKPSLSGKQRRHLRALAHHLEPIVQLGKHGVTDGVIEAVRSALESHELIKLKMGKECPSTLADAGSAVEAGAGAQLVGTIGKTMILYRRHRSEPKIVLPRA